MSTVMEETDGFTKQYSCDMAIYLTTVLSYLYGIIIECAINAPVRVNNFVGGLNSTDKHYLEEQMKFLDKSERNDISKITILTIASKDISVNVSEQFLQILTNNDRWNGIKGIIKVQNIESPFKYQSCF